MFEILNEVAVLEDRYGKTLGVSLQKNGEVMFSRPSGKPGRVLGVLQITRDEARQLARALLDMVGENDQ